MKNVLVTGCARGLGLAVSRRLYAEGYHTIGVGRTLSGDYSGLMDAAGPGRATFHEFDLENRGGISALVGGITKQHGPLYGLVNNAGLGLDGVLATMHATDIEKLLRVNLEAPILMTKFACRTMLTQRDGRIVNVASVIGTTGFSGLSVYAASKAGLVGFTKSLSRELGKAGITVNCVAPGFMETDMTKGLPDEKFESIRRRAPLGLPTVDDAAAAVAYLLSTDARRVTGTVLTIDGGSTA